MQHKNNVIFILDYSYLCGYIYLKSLDQDRHKSLFIHVPKSRENLDVPQMSRAILSIIENCIKQLDGNAK